MAASKNASTSGTFTVAPGRTVSTPDGDKGPGSQVDLAPDEAERLRSLGFLLSDDGSVTFNADGPAVNVEDGVRVEPKQ